MKGILGLLLRAGVLIIGIGYSLASSSSCSLRPAGGADQNNGLIISMSIGPSPNAIRMPADIPVGTEIYRITARNNKYYYYRIGCDTNTTPANYYIRAQFLGGAEPARSEWQGSGLGVVYKTNLAGVGVVYLMGSANKKLGEKIHSFGDCRYGSPNYSCNLYSSDGEITFVFIKTGKLTDNAVDLTQVSKVEVIVGGESEPVNEMVVYRPSLTGSIAFTQATCTLAESSKTVDLGKHAASDFIAATSATVWVDTSISLINCNYGGDQSYQYNILQSGWNSTAITTIKNPNTNKATWNLTLIPATTVIDDTNGIMAVSSVPGSATGVGIQFSTTNTATPSPVKFSQPTTGTMVSGTNAIMTLPLYARYIKTGSTVTAGLANGKVTYLVEYK